MKRYTLIAAFVATLISSTATHAGIVHFNAALSGPAESPANASLATGMADVFFDTVANTMEVKVSFSGLRGLVTASHIHCCTASADAGTAGVATQTPFFVGFPTGVTSGTYDHTFDMALVSSYNPSFVTAHGGTIASAEVALFAGMEAHDAYFNIHTAVFPGGEIRGFLHDVTNVPEPESISLLGLGLLGLVAVRRRKQS
jgi:hypothetical protein